MVRGWMGFYYCSPSETFSVLTADQFLRRDGLLEQQRQDSHVCWKNRQTRVLTTKATKYKKLRITEEWNSWYVMIVKMNTTNIYENLWVCSAHCCISHCLRQKLWNLEMLNKYRKFPRYKRAGWNKLTAVINWPSFSLVKEVAPTQSWMQRR